MTLKMSLKYWFARAFGGVTGINSPDKARETIIADFKRAKYDIRVVSCTADASYWNNDVLDLLKARMANSQMNVEFMIGPDFSNPALEKLADEGKISLITLKERPPFDLRIIDNCDTYISNHGDAGQPRRYCWTFGNLHALKDRLEHYQLIKEAA